MIQPIDVPPSARALLYWMIYAVIIILFTAIFNRNDGFIAFMQEEARRYDEQATAHEYADTIIESVFTYERQNAGTRRALVIEPIDLHLLLRSVVGRYRYLAAKRHVLLELDARNTPQHICCDERKLQWIVSSLLHDAIKAANPNTSVAIDVHLYGHMLVIVVSDSGNGIDTNMKHRRLEPFGVRELVDAFQGSIKVMNNQAGGITVTICLLLSELAP